MQELFRANGVILRGAVKICDYLFWKIIQAPLRWNSFVFISSGLGPGTVACARLDRVSRGV